MAVVAKMKKGVCNLRIENEMTIYTALELKNELIPYLEKVPHLELDCSHVPEIDSAGLQVLVLLKREALQRGSTMAIVGHSKALTDVIDTFNMASYFGDPIVMH